MAGRERGVVGLIGISMAGAPALRILAGAAPRIGLSIGSSESNRSPRPAFLLSRIDHLKSPVTGSNRA